MSEAVATRLPSAESAARVGSELLVDACSPERLDRVDGRTVALRARLDLDGGPSTGSR